MSKAGKIVFWIIFPIINIIILALILFYYDLANGPLILFILNLVVFAAFLVVRILLRHKKFVLRMIPSIAFILTTALLVTFAKPTVERKSIAYYSNPTKTEVMTLRDGQVIGLLNEDKTVRMYAGIPYAKAPVGDLRWKEPVNPETWSDVRDCTYFASKSMQPASNQITSTLVDIYSSKGWYPNYNMIPEEPMSEDSLYLNIWRPNTDETNLPILMFIHGGSLTTGSSSYEDYNGEEMAKKGVIMITISYRLGVFGYFAHQDLINESPNNTTGNYGLLDQIQALKWINENATYFGGDKTNITVAGESAGSSSVSALCTSPLAKGLFKRAIGESSSLVVKNVPHTYRSKEDALKVGADILKEFNCKTIEELRKISADQLVQTQFKNQGMILDGYALTKDPYQVYLDHDNNEEALLNGYNVKEADAFVVPQYLFDPTNESNIKERLISTFGEVLGNKIYDLYLDKIKEDAFTAFNEIFSVFWFINPHHSWSNMAVDNGIDVYRYQFTKDNKFHETYHAGEMIYAYGNVKRCPYSYRYNDSDINLSNIMLSYWSNFAKTGNPNGDNLPTWNKYTGSGDKVMELGANVGPITDRYLSLYPLIEEYNPTL